MRYSITSNCKNLSINWEKKFFWEKWNFETIANSAHTAEFLALGKHGVSPCKVWETFFTKKGFRGGTSFKG